MTVLLATPVDDAGELTAAGAGAAARSRVVRALRGEADVERLGLVRRAGTVVALAGIGALHSGRYSVGPCVTPSPPLRTR